MGFLVLIDLPSLGVAANTGDSSHRAVLCSCVSIMNRGFLRYSYPLVCRVLRTRNLVKKISNPAKKIAGSGKRSSLTRNKLL